MVYISFVLIIYGFCAVHFHKDGRDAQLFSGILMCIFYAAFWSTRDYTFGSDTLSYYSAYNDANDLTQFLDNSNSYEVGFNFILSLCKSLGLSFQFFLFLVNLIISLMFLFGFKRKTSVYLLATATLLVSKPMIGFSTNIVRQGIALAIVFYCFSQYRAGSFKRTLFLFFPLFFHLSSLYTILLVIISTRIKVINFKILSSLAISSMLIFLLFDLNSIFEFMIESQFSDKFSARGQAYLEDENQINIGIGFFTSISVLIFYYITTRVKSRCSYSIDGERVFFVTSALLISLLFMHESAVLARFTSYFLPFEVLLFFLTLTHYSHRFLLFTSVFFASAIKAFVTLPPLGWL